MILKRGQKVVVYYFSGTGNTQLIAKKIIESFRNRQFEATLVSMEHAGKLELNDGAVIGIGAGLIHQSKRGKPISVFGGHYRSGLPKKQN